MVCICTFFHIYLHFRAFQFVAKFIFALFKFHPILALGTIREVISNKDKLVQLEYVPKDVHITLQKRFERQKNYSDYPSDVSIRKLWLRMSLQGLILLNICYDIDCYYVILREIDENIYLVHSYNP